MKGNNIKPIIKLCGMRDIRQIMSLNPDYISYIGFIFFNKSPRNSFNVPEEDIIQAGLKYKTVGVFVNEKFEVIHSICKKRNIHTVQLHGEESPELCNRLKNEGYSVIKAISIQKDKEDDLSSRTQMYENCVDILLFDTAGKNIGGTGTKFNWEILSTYNGKIPYLLSGGIGIDDTATLNDLILRFNKLIGFDLNSRFEHSPGNKDIDLVNRFIRKIYD